MRRCWRVKVPLNCVERSVHFVEVNPWKLLADPLLGSFRISAVVREYFSRCPAAVEEVADTHNAGRGVEGVSYF